MAYEITPNDNDIIPNPSNQDLSGNNGCVLYVGTGGNLRVLTVGNSDITFSNIQSGQFVPVHVLKVYATGTTATDIIALW